MVTVYILHSESTDRYYVGMTQNTRRRLQEHLSGHTRSTATAKDWKIIWHEQLPDSKEARALERKIKKRGAKRFLADQGT